MPVRPRRAGEAGFTLVVVLGALLVSALLSVAAFAAVNNDMRESGKDIGRKQALAAAEAGVNDYLFHLNQDNGYWAKCTAVAAPNAVNDAWNGTLPDPRRWRAVPNSSSAYTIELLPVAPFTMCTPGASVAASMIDRSSRSLRIRVTGRVPTAKGMDYRSLIGAVKRDGFLDFLYFTDYETSDAVWYAVATSGRPTGGLQGDVISWAASNCNTTYYYNGRGSLKWNGKYTDTNTTAPQITCSQIQFADNDVVAGPLHTNDDLYTCNNPTFGRTAQDRIESGDGYRTACGASEAPNFKGTFLTKQKVIGMPATNAQLAAIAKPAYTFSGAQRITLAAGGITVQNIRTGITTSLAYPTNGVIYVKNDSGGSCPSYQPLNPDSATNYCGNARLTGTYGADLTIATENDIVIDGDVTRSGDSLLGLIANQFVRVANPSTPADHDPPPTGTSTSNWCDNVAATANRTIEAAILSLKHSFTVDNYYCGHPIGTLTVKGVIAQRFRGPVGTGGSSGASTGYVKNYQYDDRLAYRSPPNFLDPVESAWRVARYTEQSPARHG
jgi:Tfp pilus assembly protein PilX